MKFFFISAIILYICSVCFEVAFCLRFEKAPGPSCDTLFVGFASTFIVATVLCVLAVVLRIFGLL